jgi:Helix-turn-helix.
VNVLVPVEVDGLGDKIRRAREEVFPGMPMRKVARIVGIPSSCLARIEQGRQASVTLSTLLRIQEGLGQTWISREVAASIQP